MKYNENQQKAIYTQNKDILVSAGAGSGKTSVMIARIAENIINHNVSTDELLVVTFTNAAATEMRQRLNKKLTSLLQDDNLNSEEIKYLQNQLDLMGQSEICTLHKFCQTIIQKYFYTIDLDPSFNIAEEGETINLKNKAIQDLFENLASQKDPDFMLLANTFDDKRGFDKIKDYVYKIYEFLTNQPNIDAFKERTFDAYSGKLDENQFAHIVNDYVCEFVEFYISSFQSLKESAYRINCEELVTILDSYIQKLSIISPANTFSQNHSLFFCIDLETLKIKDKSPEALEIKENAQAIKKKFTETFKKIKQDVYLSPNINEIEKSLIISKSIVKAMFNVVEKFKARFLKLKKERNLVDFSDLEHFAYQILQNEQVSQEVKSKYKQIYVDEYQDINDIQESIIASIHTQKDLFLVGDVKQSIYGFRNTNPQIFLHKHYSFSNEEDPNTLALPLNENYRTDQKILDFVNFLFSNLMTSKQSGIDYAPSHKMISGKKFLQNSIPPVEILIVEKEKEKKEKLTPPKVYQVSTAPVIEDEEKNYAQSEAYVIYNKILELMSEKTQIFDASIGENGGFREVEFNDITLLVKSRCEYVDILLKELSDLGVPLATFSQNDIFKEYEIQTLYTYLSLVNNMTDDIKLTHFLTSPIINLDENELSEIRLSAKDLPYFYQCVQNYPQNDQIKQKIDYAISLIEYGREFLINKTIYELLVDFCEKTCYLELLNAFEGGQTRVRNVEGYLNSFIGKKYNTDLCEYLANIENNSTSPKIVPEYDLGASVIGVETMHHSKGLEYPIVFLINSSHNFNKDEYKGDFLLHSKYGVGMYTYDTQKRYKKPTLSHTAMKIAIKNKQFAENLRLLYVAMTRAKNHLFITGSINLETITPNISQFALKSAPSFLHLVLSNLNYDDIQNLHNNKKLHIQTENNTNILLSTHPSARNLNPFLPRRERETTNEIDADFVKLLTNNCGYQYPYSTSTTTALKTSVTTLNKLIEEDEGIVSKTSTPQNFSITEGSPISISPVNTKIGIAYHKAMQLIDFSLHSLQEVEAFLQANLSNEEFLLIDCGKILKAVQNLQPLVKDAKILREQQFLMRIPLCELIDTEVKDCVLIQGVIDLIVVKNNQIFIVDYKTSASKNIEQTAKNYKTQLHCYQKAVEGALNCKITQKFLYFFLQERLILFDNE